MAGLYDSSNSFPSYRTTLASILEAAAKAKKRRAYFAFHFADIMRVNNVRQAWKIDHPDAPDMRSFYDSIPDLWGPNPLAYMAVGKVQPEPQNLLGYRSTLGSLLAGAAPKYYLFEQTEQGWVRYNDYMNAVELPAYLADPQIGYVTPLLAGTAVYDYVSGEGHKNIGAWIDLAAQQVGR